MLICAAVKFHIISTNRDVVLCGVRHSDCFTQMADMGHRPKDDYVEIAQGFVTHKGEFLDRNEAWAHAKDCGQLAVSISNTWQPIPGELYSEDLW